MDDLIPAPAEELPEVWCKHCDQPAVVNRLVNAGGTIETAALCADHNWLALQ